MPEDDIEKPNKQIEEVVVENQSSDIQSNDFISPTQKIIDKSKKVNVDVGTPTDKDKEIKEPVNNKKYDYSFLKDLSKDDFDKYKDIKAKDESLYYELLSNRNDMKKNQRLVGEREQELNKLKNVLPVDERLKKYEEFIDGLKKDSAGTYKRFQREFDLPDIDYLASQTQDETSVEGKLKQYQEQELIPNIENKFGLPAGGFIYDPSEAYTAGTASYDYRVNTANQENKLFSEYENIKKSQEDILKRVKDQTDKDLVFLKETYFPNSNYGDADEANKAFTGYLNELDEVQKQIKTGQFESEKNPFSLRNVFKGFHFDNLLKKAIEKEVAAIHAEYNSKGLYLPNKEMPTNINNVKGEAEAINKTNMKNKYSPVQRMLNKTINK